MYPKKICNKCKENKELSAYNKRTESPDGHQNHCRACGKITDHEACVRAYGITSETYRIMLENQEYKCAICKIHADDYYLISKRRLAVDHCHKTGKVRAILCSSCNNGLGRFKDNPILLLEAHAYIRSHQG